MLEVTRSLSEQRAELFELDETYCGGKQRYVGRGSLEGKTMVLGSRRSSGEKIGFAWTAAKRVAKKFFMASW